MDKMVWFKIIIVLLIPFAILPAIKFVLIYLYNSIFKPGKSADEWKLIQMIKEKNKPIH
jgi:hypothetical protein